MPYRGYVRDRYGRRYDEEEDRYGREGVSSRDYDYNYDRYDREERRGRERGEDRGFFDRAGDEVRSWFGDKEAERRRRAERGERYDREEDEGYRRGRYHEPVFRSREYDRGEPSYDRGEYEPGRRGYSGQDPDYPSMYGERERTYPESRSARRSYRGLGPRGYQRSDQRIWEDINDRLTEDDEIDASDIEVIVNNGDVTLNGTVDDRWTKRRVEDVVEEVTGVGEVINQLRTRRGGRAREEARTDKQVVNIENDLRGKAVLRSRTGEKLGEVADVIIHPTEGRLLGLAIRTPHGEDRALVARDFVIGNDAIMAAAEARMDEEGFRGMMADGVPASARLVGSNVVTEDGNMIGRVSEVYITTDTQRVIYRIAESRLKQLFGGGFYMAGDVIRALSPEGGRIIVPADTEQRYAASSIRDILERMGTDTSRRTDAEVSEPGERATARSRSTTTRSS